MGKLEFYVYFSTSLEIEKWKNSYRNSTAVGECIATQQSMELTIPMHSEIVQRKQEWGGLGYKRQQKIDYNRAFLMIFHTS